MECTSCGQELSPEAGFCSNCGTKLKREIPDLKKLPHETYINPQVCPKCGSTKTKKESKFFVVIKTLFMMLLLGWIPILGWIVVILGLIIIAGTIITHTDYKCKECNNSYDPNDIEKGHPLMEAIEVEDMESIKKYTNKISNLDAVNKDGYTPLTWAVEKADSEVVKYLINSGADINFRDKNGLKAIDLAEKYDESRIINLLKNN